MTIILFFRLEKQINVYLDDPDSEVTLNLGPDMRKIHFCFSLLKVWLHFDYQLLCSVRS